MYIDFIDNKKIMHNSLKSKKLIRRINSHIQLYLSLCSTASVYGYEYYYVKLTSLFELIKTDLMYLIDLSDLSIIDVDDILLDVLLLEYENIN